MVPAAAPAVALAALVVAVAVQAFEAGVAADHV